YIYFMLIFASSCIIFITLLAEVYAHRNSISDRLKRIDDMYKEGDEIINQRKLPFRDRIIDPFKNNVKNFIENITPRQRRAELEMNLRAANYPYGLGVNGWIVLKGFFYFVVPLVFLYMISQNSGMSLNTVLMTVVITIICFMFPNAVLKGRVNIRKKNMIREFPDILDMLTISVEAGLSLDGAMAKVVEKSKGDFSSEFERVLNEIQLGKTRRNALSDMAQRCNISEVTAFISAIIQAEQMGVGVAKVLRIQALQARHKRKQYAKEQAMKASVKILFPLVIFIFPAIFVVILGPAAIQILKFLQNS
ncbi:MAG: type II secretion system F family protein, partial [Clostridiaceae bacterium]